MTAAFHTSQQFARRSGRLNLRYPTKTVPLRHPPLIKSVTQIITLSSTLQSFHPSVPLVPHILIVLVFLHPFDPLLF